MKKILFALAAIVWLSNGFAQKEIKFSKIYYLGVAKEGEDFDIRVTDAVSVDDETKFKIKITNKTSDFLILKPEECKFIINGKEMVPKEKMIIVDPNESASKVFNCKLPEANKLKNYKFVLGGMSRVSPKANPVTAPDFKLPASTNEFTAGGFTCTMTKLSKETQSTDVKFDIAYNGNKIGFFNPGKVAVEMPDGNSYVNGGKNKLLMLTKGKEDSFALFWDRMQGGKTTDMQKVVMMIKWNSAFTEGTPEKIAPMEFDLAFDEPTSMEKGR